MQVIPDHHLDRLVALVGRGVRVALVEHADPRLAVRLRAEHCEVTALGVERRYLDRFTPFCARVFAADEAEHEGYCAATAVGDTCDAVVAPLSDQSLPNLCGLLERVGPLVRTNGSLALLVQRVRPLPPANDANDGGSPADDSGGDWTLQAISDALSRGGFLVTAVEWLAIPGAASAGSRNAVVGACNLGRAPSPVEAMVATLACEAADLRLALKAAPGAMTTARSIPAPIPQPAATVDADAAGASGEDDVSADDYPTTVRRVRELILHAIPTRSTILVVTRGDEAFLQLGSRTGWHFPRATSGEWAGFYPATSLDAIDHVEELRQLGAEYLVFPRASSWWLDHYAGLTRHLNASYVRLSTATDAVVYQLFNAGVAADA